MSDPAAETDATAPSENVARLNARRSGIVNAASRYLSAGALVTETAADDTVSQARNIATCTDGMGATDANCVFPMDSFRDEVTFHLGRTNTGDDVNDVGFIGFTADRQPVMDYRGVRMSQVRVTGTDTKENMDPAEDPVKNNYEYVGYDGMLQYSMFFVGVYKFFDGGTDDDDPELQHLRFENASLGRIYDQDGDTPGVQKPNIDLTGVGVMVGMESDVDTLNSHLVQGDVDISYTESSSSIDIAITNIKRLVGSGTAWYADPTRIANLDWNGVTVDDDSTFESSQAELSGSFYGRPDTDDADDVDNGIYEVGGVFYHADGGYSIFGAFGSTLKSDVQSQ